MPSRGIILAAIIFLASVSATVFAYARILEIERPAFVFLDDYLSVGRREFLFKSEGSCIGSISVDIWREKATTIKTTGVLRATLNSKNIDIKIESQSYFNPLGQMTDSTTRLTGPNFMASAITKEIHPIKVTLALNAAGKDLSLNKELPGPIQVAESTPGKLHLEYSQVAPVQPIAFNGPVEFVKSEYNLAIEPASDSNTCNSSGRIDLSRMIKKLQTFTGKSAVGAL